MVSTTFCGGCGANIPEAKLKGHIARAEEHEKSGKTAYALEEYRQALKLDPDNPDLTAKLDSLSSNFRKVEQLRGDCEWALERGEYSEAMEIGAEILKCAPDDKKTINTLAEIPELIKNRQVFQLTETVNQDIARGDYKKAFEHANHLLQIDPNSLYGLEVIKQINSQLDELAKAERVRFAHKKKMQFAGIAFLAFCLAALGVFYLATIYANKKHYEMGKKLLAAQDIAGALEEFEKSGSLGLDRAEKSALMDTLLVQAYPTWLQEARDKLNKKDYEGAMADIQKILKYRPNDPAGLELRKKLAPANGIIMTGFNEQGLAEYRHIQSNITLVLVPGGVSKMGSDNSADTSPVHEVALSAFLVSKYEITQGEWEKVMGYNNSKIQNSDSHPVENVTWDDCQKFCQKTGLRLLTEAEWEYACRAGTSTKYFWGNEPDESCFWFDVNSSVTTHSAGGRKSNKYGLFDLSGNVCEWVNDWYEENYYQRSPKENPPGPAMGKYKVVRGGAFNDKAIAAACSYRYWFKPREASNFIGFRCALDLR